MELLIGQKKVYGYTGGKSFDKDLPCLIFLHGAQNDHSVWAMQSRYFANHGYAVLALDLPGHGRSDGPALRSIEAMAAWLKQVINNLENREVIIIGHSMGSLIALEAAANWSATEIQLRGLALLGCAFPMRVSPELLEASLHQPLQAIEMVAQWSHALHCHQPAAPGPGFSVLNMSRRLMQNILKAQPEPVFHIDFNACNDYQNGQLAAQAIQIPTLFLNARQDMMTPAKASLSFSKHFSQAQTVQLERAGHAMMNEQARIVVSHLGDFFNTSLKP